MSANIEALFDNLSLLRFIIAEVQELKISESETLEERKPKILSETLKFKSRCQKELHEQWNKEEGQAEVTIAVVGDFSAGKSTFINALLGENICPTSSEPTTSSITYFSHGQREKIEIQTEDGRQEISSSKYEKMVCHFHENQENNKPYTFFVQRPFSHFQFIRIIDTPGFNNPKNPHDSEVTRKAVKSADVLFVIFDINKGSVNSTLLREIKALNQSGQPQKIPSYLLINKSDMKDNPVQRKNILQKNERKHSKTFEKIMLVSSSELSNGPDGEILRNLSEELHTIEDSVSKREAFQTQISAQIDPNTNQYQLFCHNKTFTTNISKNNDLSTRQDILSLLNSVKEQRPKTLERRSENSRIILRREKRDLMKTLKNFIREVEIHYRFNSIGGTSNRGPIDSITDIEQLYQKKILDLLQGVIDDCISQLCTIDKRTKKGIFSDTTYFDLKVDCARSNDLILKNPNLNHIQYLLDNYVDSMNTECDSDITSIIYSKPDILESFKKILFDDYLHEGSFSTETLLDSYETRREARKAELEFIKHFDFEDITKKLFHSLISPIFQSIREQALIAIGTSDGIDITKQSHQEEIIKKIKELLTELEGKDL